MLPGSACMCIFDPREWNKVYGAMVLPLGDVLHWLGGHMKNLKSIAFAGALMSMSAGMSLAQDVSISPDTKVALRFSLSSDFVRGGVPRDFERNYLRFEGGIGLDIDFGSFVITPRVTSFGWNSELSPGRTENNALLPSIDLATGNWVFSFGDIQGRPLPLADGISGHTVIETRPIYAYYGTRQDTDSENGEPIDGFRDNSRTTSAGKLALAYNGDDWFVRAIIDPGLLQDYDPVADTMVERQYVRLEGGKDFPLANGASLRTGAAVWHQDSYQNTSGNIVDASTGTKSARWGAGATGAELGVVLGFGKFDLGVSATAIRGPYSDGVTSTAPDDIRGAVHLTTSYQISDVWSLAGTYSQTRWELSNGPALGVQTGRLLQVGAEVQVSDRVSVGFGYVWSDSSGWSGGAHPAAKLSYPVLGVGISF